MRPLGWGRCRWLTRYRLLVSIGLSQKKARSCVFSMVIRQTILVMLVYPDDVKIAKAISWLRGSAPTVVVDANGTVICYRKPWKHCLNTKPSSGKKPSRPLASLRIQIGTTALLRRVHKFILVDTKKQPLNDATYRWRVHLWQSGRFAQCPAFGEGLRARL